MSSVTNTFVWTLPLCTMNVRPTNSGTIVQARAHVLIGSLEPVCCAACTFLNTLKSTNGPFLLDLLIPICLAYVPLTDSLTHSLLQLEYSVPPRLPPPHDRLIRGLPPLPGESAL